MGTYIYTVRAKKTNIIDQDLRVRPAYLISYAKKDSFWQKLSPRQKDFAMDALYTAQLQNALFVIGDEPENNSPVYEDWDQAVWYDSDKPAGKLVGWLKQGSNRRWYLVKETSWKRWRGSIGGDAHCTLYEERCVLDETGKMSRQTRYPQLGIKIGESVSYGRSKGYLAGYARDGKPIFFWGNPKTEEGEKEFNGMIERWA